MAPDTNILFILIDDLGYSDLGCYGSSFYETPCINRLARESLRFSDGYAAAPVCSPTRASLMTGKYPATVGITNYVPGNAWGKLMGVPYFHALPKSETTVAAALRDGGYATWHVGKWHLGPEDHFPERFGFDLNVGGCNWGAPKNGYFAPWGIPTLRESPDGTYLTDRITDEAIALIERGTDDGRPWFMHLSHYAVHTPLQAPQDLIAKYEAKARDLGLDQIEALVEGEAFPCLHKKDERVLRRVVQSHAVYAAMIENLDTNVGRTLDALERTGQAENTLVIFTSDNGGLSSAEGSPTCNAPLSEGKGWMYDGGLREPWIVLWPGVTSAGTTCGEPITSPDLFPTLLDVAGLPAKPEQHCDGRSFAAALRGEPFERGPIFWHYPHYSNQGGSPAASVREGRWKLIHFFEDDRDELYDLHDDVGEQRDLAATQTPIAKRLRRSLDHWQERVAAKIPERNPDYEAMLNGTMPCVDGFGRIPGDDH